MVPREQHSIFRIKQTKMVEGMAGSVNSKPVTIGEPNGIAVGYPDCWVRRKKTAVTCGVHVQPFEHHFVWWRLTDLTPRGSFGFGDPLFPELDNLLVVHFEQFQVEVVSGLQNSAVERLMREYLGSGDLSELVAPPEVVGVAVSHHHRVDPLDGYRRRRQTIHESLPRLLTGETRVDQGDTVGVFEGVAIHMTQPGHRNRQLHPQHPRGYFTNFRRGRFLFLFAVDRSSHPGTLEDCRGSGYARRNTEDSRGSGYARRKHSHPGTLEDSRGSGYARRNTERCRGSGYARRKHSHPGTLEDCRGSGYARRKHSYARRNTVAR